MKPIEVMPVESDLTCQEAEMLCGLKSGGPALISATEFNLASSLCSRGYAHTWTTIPLGLRALRAWRITERGVAALTAHECAKAGG